MLKQELRKEIRQRKRQISTEQLALMSCEITSWLLSHPRVKAAKTILMYCSLPDEVDTHDLLDRLVVMGKTVLLPVVIGESEMQLRIYHSTSALKAGAYNIMEPSGEVFTSLQDIDVAIVPGMAFDANGNRLGRGKGYYDRFLPLIPHSYKIGVCFPFQFINAVPTTPFDVQMDEVIHGKTIK